jgi:hypothetical protein
MLDLTDLGVGTEYHHEVGPHRAEQRGGVGEQRPVRMGPEKPERLHQDLVVCPVLAHDQDARFARTTLRGRGWTAADQRQALLGWAPMNPGGF